MADERIGHYRGFGIYKRNDGTMYGEFTNEKRGRVSVGNVYAVTPIAVRDCIDRWYEEQDERMERKDI